MSEKTEFKLKEVTKTYRMGEVEVPVLRGMNVDIRRGELTEITAGLSEGDMVVVAP